MGAERDQQRRNRRRCQGDDRTGTKDPGGGRAEDRPLLQQTEDVVVRLQKRRADPTGKGRLGFADHPQQQRRHDECQKNMNDAVGHVRSPQRPVSVPRASE